jgi:hypothetical protein
MSVKSLRRAAALTLLVLLAAASSAQAASAASPSGILELLWRQIAGSLSKTGCSADPNGILCAKEGCTVDPNGARCVKNGCTVDPNGGTCPKHIPAGSGGLRNPSGRAFGKGTF